MVKKINKNKPYKAHEKPTGHFITQDNHWIPYSLWNARVSHGCFIIGVHSFGDYRESFSDIAAFLNNCGHNVLAYDQRGFGSTPLRGIYASDEAYIHDLALVCREAKRLTHNEQPIVVMAESFGGSVAICAQAKGLLDIKGLVLCGPGVRENLPAKSLWDVLISTASAVLGSTAVKLNHHTSDLTDMADARWKCDPLMVRELRADTYEKVVALADRASCDAQNISCPVMVQYGENDKIIARSSIDALVKRLGDKAKVCVYPKRPHLILHARHRDDIKRDTLSFLSALN